MGKVADTQTAADIRLRDTLAFHSTESSLADKQGLTGSWNLTVPYSVLLTEDGEPDIRAHGPAERGKQRCEEK